MDGETTNATATNPFPIGTYTNNTASVKNNQIEGFATYPNPVTSDNVTITSNSADKKEVAIDILHMDEAFEEEIPIVNVNTPPPPPPPIAVQESIKVIEDVITDMSRYHKFLRRQEILKNKGLILCPIPDCNSFSINDDSLLKESSNYLSEKYGKFLENKSDENFNKKKLEIICRRLKENIIEKFTFHHEITGITAKFAISVYFSVDIQKAKSN